MNFEDFFNNQNLLNLALKSFGIVFSFIYLIASITLYQQIKIMKKTVGTSLGEIINTISLFEIILAVFIFVWAIFFL